MFCTNCGASLDDDTKFCTSCGAKVEEADVPAAAPAPEPQVSALVQDDVNTTILSAIEEAAKDPVAEFNKDPSIKLIAGDGREFKTSKFPCTVGKGSAAGLQISGNNAISREHLELTFKDGEFFVEDMNSSNSTYVNGNKIEPKVACAVKSGDEIKLADEVFTVEVDL